MEKMATKWHRPKHQGDRWKGPDYIGFIFTFILCSLTIFFAVDYGIYFCAWQKNTNEKNMDLLSNQTNLDFHVSTRPPFITCHLST